MTMNPLDELVSVRKDIQALRAREADLEEQVRTVLKNGRAESPQRHRYPAGGVAGRILELLAAGPKTAREMAVTIGDPGVPTKVSRLRRVGVVIRLASGQYALANGASHKPAVSPEHSSNQDSTLQERPAES